MAINNTNSLSSKRRFDDDSIDMQPKDSRSIDSQFSKRHRQSSTTPSLWTDLFNLGDNVSDMNSLMKSLDLMIQTIFQNWNSSQSTKNMLFEGLHCCITEMPTKTDVYACLIALSSSFSLESEETRKSFLQSFFDYICIKTNDHWKSSQWIQFELALSFLTKSCVYGLYSPQLWIQGMVEPLLLHQSDHPQFNLVSIYLHYCLLTQIPIIDHSIPSGIENPLIPIIDRMKPFISLHKHLVKLHVPIDTDLIKLSSLVSSTNLSLSWKLELEQSYGHLYFPQYFFDYSSFYMNDNDQPFYFPKRTIFTRFYIRNVIRQSFLLSSHNHKACMEYLLNPQSFHHHYLDITSWSRCIIEVLFTEILRDSYEYNINGYDIPVVYYHILMMDALTISTSTVAKQIGEAVNTLFYNSKDLSRYQISLFSQWFAHHLSNFSFKWKWDTWQKNLEESSDNDNKSKELFLTQVFQNLVRLSYYDRIKEVIPTYFHDYLINPSFYFPFIGDDGSIQSPLLKSLCNAIKAKEPSSSIELLLTPGKSSEAYKLWSKHHERSDDYPLQCLVHALLYNGSKSFTHSIAIIERYLEVLKKITTKESDRGLLINILTEAWKDNDIFIDFIIGKLVKLKVLDTNDVLMHYLHRLESSPDYTWNQTTWSIVRKQCTNLENYAKAIYFVASLSKNEHERSFSKNGKCECSSKKALFEYLNYFVSKILLISLSNTNGIKQVSDILENVNAIPCLKNIGFLFDFEK